MEEKPFESLALGLDKDLSGLMTSAQLGRSETALRAPLVSAFGGDGPVFGMGTPRTKNFAQQPFPMLSDQFAKQIAVFPLTSHVVINQFGAFIPQSIFGNQADIAYREDRQPDGNITITVHSMRDSAKNFRRPRFGSAKGLIKMSDDFDQPLEDFADYMR